MYLCLFHGKSNIIHFLAQGLREYQQRAHYNCYGICMTHLRGIRNCVETINTVNKRSENFKIVPCAGSELTYKLNE